jgi:hypothetical protein
MRRSLLATGALALCAALASAQDDSLAKVQKDLDALYMKSQKSGGPSKEEISKLLDRALDIATDHKGDAAGFDAYAYVVNMAGNVEEKRGLELFTESMDALIETWLNDDKMASLLMGPLAYPPEAMKAKAKEYRDWIARDSKSESVKASVEYLDARARSAKTIDAVSAKKLIAELQDMKKRFGSKAAAYGRTFDQMLDTEIEGLKVVGTPAQEIDGQDLDGVGFKLSDYRGKVVLLDFWGYW